MDVSIGTLTFQIVYDIKTKKEVPYESNRTENRSGGRYDP